MRGMTKFLILIFLLILISTTCYAITFEPGASVRLRQEIWDNVVDLGTMPDKQPDRNFFRLRLQLWNEIKFNNNLSLYGRLTTEPKYYTGPYRLSLDYEGKEYTNKKRFDQDELIIDNLYLDIKKPFDLPFNLRLGRQDFLGKDMYGEGFLILDGTPGDGSRTFYFNALKATLLIADGHTVDIVYVSNPKTDQYLPSLHPSYYDKPTGGLYINHKKRLTASNERGFWIYGRHKILEGLKIEPYYIYKKEKEYDVIKENYINTFGLRAIFSISDFSLRGELAKQFGKYDNEVKRRGLGGYIFATYTFKKCPITPSLEAGYVYLSGDKSDTKDKDEGFDPLFSRAPQWNELLIYTLVPETSGKGGPIPGYWTNLKGLVTKLKLNPIKDLNVTLSYQHFWADEKTNGLPSVMFSNDGKNRGDLWVALVAYKFNKNLDGFVQIEYFEPGNFYSNKARNATFFRWQLQYKL